MPSMFQAVLVKFVPFPVKTLCWPLLLDPVITLSVNTPGVCCRIPHGSRELGIVFNSSCVKFVPARSLCVSSSGTSELTVPAADTPGSRDETRSREDERRRAKPRRIDGFRSPDGFPKSRTLHARSLRRPKVANGMHMPRTKGRSDPLEGRLEPVAVTAKGRIRFA